MKNELKTLIVIDTETGGLDYKTHSLLTLALVVVVDNKIVEQKEWKIKSKTYNVTPQALDVNGINILEFDKSAQEGEEVAKEVTELLNRYCSKENKGVLVGQNTIFDKNFLESFLDSLKDKSYLWNFRKVVSHRLIDLMSITAFMNISRIIATDDLKLDSVIKELGIQVENRHTALDDCLATYKALTKMAAMCRGRRGENVHLR